MKNNGFIKVCSVSMKIDVGNPFSNINTIKDIVSNNKASYIVFPELCITGYTCGDLFYNNTLLNDSNNAIIKLLNENAFDGILIVGAPYEVLGSLYNCAFVIKKNELLGIVPKRCLPNSREFYEKRWFKSSAFNNMDTVNFNGKEVPFGNIIFDDNEKNVHFGVELCEDMWAPITPSNMLSYHGANLIFNLSASNAILNKDITRLNAVLENSRRNCSGYIYSSAGPCESTSDTLFSSHNIIASCGSLIKEDKELSFDNKLLYADIDIDYINYKRRLNTNLHDMISISLKYKHVNYHLDNKDNYIFEDKIDTTPFIPKGNHEVLYNKFKEITQIQAYALARRIMHTNSSKIVIGISGGLDSTLALMVCVDTMKILNRNNKDIIAVTMPGYATSTRTKSNAIKLMENLGVDIRNIPITSECDLHLDMIGHNKNLKDVTYENTQARIRTLILMNIANKENGLVVGTGDMSELALGWCTYNGDQMSMYGLNCGIPKTLVKFLTEQYAKINLDVKDVLTDILDTPISPELSSQSQKTEDFIGKYEINDFIMYRFLSCGDDEERITYLVSKAFNLDENDSKEAVKRFFKRFYVSQFKRQASPDGVKVLDISLSARTDYRIPSDIRR